MERTLAAARFEPTLFPKHLPSQIRVQVTRTALTHEPSAGAGCGGPVDQRLPSLQDYRDSVYARAEKQYLLELLEQSSENISEACQIANLSQSRLYALLKKYGLSRKG